MGIKNQNKKIKLAKQNRRTSWAPVWAVLKKYGMGKRMGQWSITRNKRSWRRTKLKIRPRKVRKGYFG